MDAVDQDVVTDRPAEAPGGELAEGRFLNRELSWLEFNARVLTLAEDRNLPLLERAKFLAIFAGNLDEFYMVRVAGVHDQIEAGIVDARRPDGLTPVQTLEAVSERARGLMERHVRHWEDSV